RLFIHFIVEGNKPVESNDGPALILQDTSSRRIRVALRVLVPPPAHPLLPYIRFSIARTGHGQLPVPHEGSEKLGHGTIARSISDDVNDAISHGSSGLVTRPHGRRVICDRSSR